VELPATPAIAVVGGTVVEPPATTPNVCTSLVMQLKSICPSASNAAALLKHF